MARDGIDSEKDVGDDEQDVESAKRLRALTISDWDLESEVCTCGRAATITSSF